MKIKPEHYQHMLTACKEAVERIPARAKYLARDPSIFNIDNMSRDVEQRYRWDLMVAAGLSEYACYTLYQYADDSHIDTALKQIVKDLNL